MHSSIPAWRIPWTEEPGGTYSPRGGKSRAPLSQAHRRASEPACLGAKPGFPAHQSHDLGHSLSSPSLDVSGGQRL